MTFYIEAGKHLMEFNDTYSRHKILLTMKSRSDLRKPCGKLEKTCQGKQTIVLRTNNQAISTASPATMRCKPQIISKYHVCHVMQMKSKDRML